MQICPAIAFAGQIMEEMLLETRASGNKANWDLHHSLSGTSRTNVTSYYKNVSAIISTTSVTASSFTGSPTIQVKTSNGINDSFTEIKTVLASNSVAYGQSVTLQVYYISYGSGYTQVKGYFNY